MTGKQPLPRVLAELQKAQVMYVAGALYRLMLSSGNRLRDLIDGLAERMRLEETCYNEACGGGPCDPAVHIFAPAQYLVLQLASVRAAGGHTTGRHE